MLSRFPSSPEDLSKAILYLDEKSFDLDSLQALKQFTPEPEEVRNHSFPSNCKISAIKAHVKSEGPDKLGKPEKYFLSVMRIPQLERRLNCWAFQRSFDTLEADVSMV